MDRRRARNDALLVCIAASLAACGQSAPSAGQSAESVAMEVPDRPTLMRIDQIGMEGGRGLYIARRDAGDTRIAFDVPTDRVAPDRLHDMEQLGETPDGVVLLLDRYASRTEAGARCAEGRETFVRAFSLRAKRELFSRPVESCLDKIAGGTPPVSWLDDGRFRIESAVPVTYIITGADRVSPMNGEGSDG